MNDIELQQTLNGVKEGIKIGEKYEGEGLTKEVVFALLESFKSKMSDQKAKETLRIIGEHYHDYGALIINTLDELEKKPDLKVVKPEDQIIVVKDD